MKRELTSCIFQADETEHSPYAVKRLHSKDYKDFQREVKALKRLSGENHHKHLINLLLTYRYRDRYHLIFDWADSNLLNYWKKKHPKPEMPVRDCKFAKWVCKQWLGIVEGLQAIHLCPLHDNEDSANIRVHGRHGDLKPENILWFKNPYFDKSAESLGAFVISDFGLTSFHRSITKSQLNPENLGRSPTYRSPEYDVQSTVSQKCDIWSLGCVLLEFMIWYLYGWEGVQNFQRARIDEDNHEIKEDVFFNRTENGVELKRSVAKVRRPNNIVSVWK
jgi:serine/threonine protein kinase